MVDDGPLHPITVWLLVENDGSSWLDVVTNQYQHYLPLVALANAGK